MGTPASALHSLQPSGQRATPGTGLRGHSGSGQPTPLTRPELGYVGLWHPASAQRRSSMAPSVSARVLAAFAP